MTAAFYGEALFVLFRVMTAAVLPLYNWLCAIRCGAVLHYWHLGYSRPEPDIVQTEGHGKHAKEST